jgi:predicted GNAT family acetyltransferase
MSAIGDIARYLVLDGNEILGWGDVRALKQFTPSKLRLDTIYDESINKSMLTNSIFKMLLLHSQDTEIQECIYRTYDPELRAIFNAQHFHEHNAFVMLGHTIVPSQTYGTYHLPENMSMEIFDPLPPNLFEDAAMLFSVLLSDMPNQNGQPFPVKVPGVFFAGNELDVHWAVLFLKEEGEYIGACFMSYLPNDLSRVAQRTTGVFRAHRGKGYARAMKGTLLNHMTARISAPCSIVTETFPYNHATVHLNQSFGFERIAEGQEFILPTR